MCSPRFSFFTRCFSFHFSFVICFLSFGRLVSHWSFYFNINSLSRLLWCYCFILSSVRSVAIAVWAIATALTIVTWSTRSFLLIVIARFTCLRFRLLVLTIVITLIVIAFSIAITSVARLSFFTALVTVTIFVSLTRIAIV